LNSTAQTFHAFPFGGHGAWPNEDERREGAPSRTKEPGGEPGNPKKMRWAVTLKSKV